MAVDPGIGYKILAKIKDVKGDCAAGHCKGEEFEISCHDPAGLCGWFYYDIFPYLSTFQFGGTLPWWKGDTVEFSCPDSSTNLVIIELTRLERD